MTALFNRDANLTIGTFKIPMRSFDPLNRPRPTLRMLFDIEKTGSSEPNTAAFEVYNLNPAHRKAIQDKWPIVFEAGYVGNVSRLFSGTINTADSRRDRHTWITTIEAADGQDQYASARMNIAFGPGTTLSSLLFACAEKLGLPPGNAAVKFNAPKRGLVLFQKGVVVSGKVSDILDKYVASAGYNWSIQDGQLQVLAPDETSVEQVVVLAPDTGLIGSPEKGEDGTITFTSLLQGEIRPGRRVSILSRNVSGFFKVLKTTYSGDTWGNDWYTHGEGKSTGP